MQRRLISFDGTESVEAECLRPDRYRHLFAAVADGCVIARGAGLNYCLASGGAQTRSVSITRFDRILSFDPGTGLVTVEAGISLGKLFRFSVPKGWLLPVMPGHPGITVGGCIACNVHGKNQYKDGAFLSVVDELTLYHPDHGELRCSPRENAGLFRLTLGGFGLTGVILTVRLKLQKTAGASYRLRRRRVGGLVETAEILKELAPQAQLLYSWHDLNGSAFGRGYVYSAYWQEARKEAALHYSHLDAEVRASWRVPLFNRLTAPLGAAAYRLEQRLSPAEETVSLASAAFPTVGKEFYFKLFGRPGFRDYQALIPAAAWKDAAEDLQGLIRRRGIAVTMSSLKVFRGKTEHLNFDGDGVCAALDVADGAAALEFFADLDAWVAASGGIFNLSRDSRFEASLVRKVYPEYDRFRSELLAFDPKRRFDSALRRRLDV